MSKKSWILAIVAVIILALGAFGSQLTSQTNVNNLLSEGSNVFSSAQNIIEVGDTNRQVAVLEVDGTIAENSGSGSFSEGMDYQGILDSIEEIKENDDVQALLLTVNSPGGGVYESAELYNALLDLKESREIPIYVSMGQMAASGGYMISMVGDQIYTDSETTTGSIGVIMQVPNFSGFMEEHGLAMDTYKSGALKDMGSSFRGASDEEKNVLNSFIQEKYNRFVEIVANGRGMSTDDVKKLADGRIYSGSQAVENGLADQIGYEEDALAALRADNNLETATVVDYSPTSATSWLTDFMSLLAEKNLFTSQSETNTADEMTQILEVLEDTSTPQFYYMYGGE
ncbi:signal peptide peptidase SppA [Carnobacterium sp. PL12RED10]|uniref:signal peptide peptidase SppA n=1 Tax=Carnobacterium sp. PL12RED10 TaxID=2592351 RepID=UPI0011EDC958|nr:signal peptide peptidase SppA [Carnobacterium sp. PL12RED10]KAF3299612.1 signal peptide peptidase SppA [Carnobacterium sp. PL12RED10]